MNGEPSFPLMDSSYQEKRTCSRAKAFFARRLSSRNCLGLHVTLGFAAWLVACGSFALIAWGIQEPRLDDALAASLHERARVSPHEVVFFKGVTALGSALVLAPVGLVGAIVLAWYRRRGLLAAWSVLLGGMLLLNLALKYSFQRPRPTFPDPVTVEPMPSFPSGHSLGALVCYGLIAYMLVLALPRRRARLAVLAAAGLVILSIGFSRLYLGVHYLSDVMGAYAVGVAWLTPGITAIHTARLRGSPALKDGMAVG